MSQLKDFRQWFGQNRVPFPDSEQESKIEEFLYYLLSWNRKMSLTADNTLQTLLTRHLLDSLIPLAIGVPDKTPVADIGSGTGFPAIPMAVMLADTPFTLVEKTARKCAFLKMAVRRLGLANVEVVETLLQDWQPIEPMARTAITRAVRLDDEFKGQLFVKGIHSLLYFSSQPTGDTVLEYQLPDEKRSRYLDRIEIQ